jgi:hypothetical protein
MPLIHVGPGVYLEENSNSNSSNSNNSSIFSHSSNSNSNSSVNEWNEEMPHNRQDPSRKLRFSETRRVRRIDPMGKSRKSNHRTHTRKHLHYNVPNKSNQSQVKAAAARLIAAAHAKKHTYNEMLEFIKHSRGPENVKAAALQRFISRYRNFNLNSNLSPGPIATMAARRHIARPVTAAAARSVTPARPVARSVTPARPVATRSVTPARKVVRARPPSP